MKLATSALAAMLAVLLLGCDRRPPNHGTLPAAKPRPTFTRINGEAGVRFQHEDGSSGRFYFPELMGPGCAFADFTGDGLPDLYLVNGTGLPGATAERSATDRFFRNNGDGTFADATRARGANDPHYGIGCCAGDYDNDGDLDLYVTNLGRNTLYRNEGSVFKDVTAEAGVGTGGFCTAASFADYDNDGDLDLYVCRYVAWSPETNKLCHAPYMDRKVRGQCRPVVYPAAPDVLYRNNGDGTFSDVTAAAGMRVPPGRGLGALWTDFDADGDVDLYVANDMTANFLFVNQGDGTFREEATARGVSVDETGRAQASMGLAAADVDGDGHLDLACTNFQGEYLVLYRGTGSGTFEDVSARSGVAQLTSPYVGFGVGLPDLDLDAWSDLFVVNGHVSGAEIPRLRESLAEPALCLINDTRGGFVPAVDPGASVGAPRVARGAAFADLEGDGDIDILCANWKAEPDLLRNDLLPAAAPAPNWLRLTLEGTTCNRGAVGARVEVSAGGRMQVQELRSGGSYCSQNELALTFGLGKAKQAERVRVRWPGGEWQTWEGLPSNRRSHLRQGRAETAP